MASPLDTALGGDGSAGEFMLFGVRVVLDSMRKSVSLNNLSQYQQPQDGVRSSSAAGYASADDVVHRTGNRGRKRGVPWTEDEHKLFLLGMQKVGRGDWRKISKNFVKTRTPIQVASHAQKYFLRQSNLNRRRRRSSLFDITIDSVMSSALKVDQSDHHNNAPQLQPNQLSSPIAPPPEPLNIAGQCTMTAAWALKLNTLPDQIANPVDYLTWGKLERVINASTLHGLNLNLMPPVNPAPLSLELSFSSDSTQASSTQSSLEMMSRVNSRDGVISAA